MEHTNKCNSCGYPMGLCICTPDTFPSIPDYIALQTFRRLMWPECYSPFTLTHYPIRDSEGFLRMVEIPNE